MGAKGSKGTKGAGEEADKAFEEARKKIDRLGAGSGGAGSGGAGSGAGSSGTGSSGTGSSGAGGEIQKFVPDGGLREALLVNRVNECMSREGRDFVRDEYMAILLTLNPSQDVNVLAAMTVDSLRKSIRAAVVNSQINNTSGKGTHAQLEKGGSGNDVDQDPA